MREFELVPISRKTFAIALFVVSVLLLWYSICTYRLSGQNPTRLGDTAAVLFPEAQVLNGHFKYLTLDHAGAAEFYKKAIFAEPSLIDAWIGLIRVKIEDGQRDEARKILNIVGPALTSISTWKWQELLFAYDLHDESYFEQCYNFILSHLPHRKAEASWLAFRFWGGWQGVVPHVFYCNHPVFLSVLIDRGGLWMPAESPLSSAAAEEQVDAAVALFKVMENGGPHREENDLLQFCDFLISNDRLKEAKRAWRLWRNDESTLVYDGRFEKAPLNRAFGWRFRDDPDVLTERASGPPCLRSSCLHIHFKGSGNLNCDLAWQIVPVEPGVSYCLSFARKSSSLSTDRGVFLAVNGYRDEKLNIASQPVLGDSTWKEDKIEFAVPAGCEAIVLRVGRNESLKMDNKISGDYWLESVELISTSNITK
jgi:hypothetical protein